MVVGVQYGSKPPWEVTTTTTTVVTGGGGSGGGGGGGGSGDVVGPASAVNLDVAVFDGTTGKLVKDGGTLLSALATTSAVAAGYQPLDSDLTTIAGLTPTTGNVIQSVAGAWASRTMAQFKVTLGVLVADIADFATGADARIAAAAATGTGNLVRATSPTLVTPVLGTPASGTLTNVTGLPQAGVVNLVTDLAAKAPLVSPSFTTPALGTPASGNLANCTFPTLNQSTSGNAATATQLATGRTIGTLTGDVTAAGSSFNGSANNSNAAVLATVNSNVGSFGSAASVATFTVDGKGRTTAAASATIAIDASQVTTGAFNLARLGPGAAAGKYLDGGSGAWTTLPRPSGFKYNCLGTSGSATDPGTGNLRFFTAGAEVMVNYTDADGIDRSGFWTAAASGSGGTVLLTHASGAVEMGICFNSPIADNGTWAEIIPSTNTIDPTLFTSGAAVYVFFVPYQ